VKTEFSGRGRRDVHLIGIWGMRENSSQRDHCGYSRARRACEPGKDEIEYGPHVLEFGMLHISHMIRLILLNIACSTEECVSFSDFRRFPQKLVCHCAATLAQHVQKLNLLGVGKSIVGGPDMRLNHQLAP
jgi:hypothetical protein